MPGSEWAVEFRQRRFEQLKAAYDQSPDRVDQEEVRRHRAAERPRVIAFLDGFKPGQIDGSEDRAIEIKTATRTLRFSGLQFLTHFALPNFFFHSTTAYDILRHNGVPIGKSDFLGPDPH